MGKMWTRGVNGVPSAIFNTGATTTAKLTVDVPESLANETHIAIRIQGANGSYAYNWFKNSNSVFEIAKSRHNRLFLLCYKKCSRPGLV